MKRYLELAEAARELLALAQRDNNPNLIAVAMQTIAEAELGEIESDKEACYLAQYISDEIKGLREWFAEEAQS